MTLAYVLIDRERREQIRKGYDLEHDAGYRYEELSRAAAAYALSPGETLRGQPFARADLWPWSVGWKPADRVTELVRAGALIVAEIERLQGV